MTEGMKSCAGCGWARGDTCANQDPCHGYARWIPIPQPRNLAPTLPPTCPPPPPPHPYAATELKINIPASQRQVGGAHYTDMKIQPFEFSMANNLDPFQHTIVKYAVRKKNKIEDLRKVIHTAELYIEHLEKSND